MTSTPSAPAQPSASQSEAPASSFISRIPGDIARVTISGNGVSNEVAPTFTATGARDDQPAPAKAGAALVARSQSGRILNGKEIGRDALVAIPGYPETSVGAAAQLGLIQQNEAGVWTYTDKIAGEAQQQDSGEQQADQPQAPKPSDPTPLDNPEAESLMVNAVSKLGNMDGIAAIAQAVDTGTLSDDLLNRVATSLGVEPEKAWEQMSTIATSLYQQAARLTGPNHEQVWAWAREHASEDLRRAAIEHARDGNASGYRPLAVRYIEQLDQLDPDAILNSRDAEARGVRRERDGTITLIHPKAGRVSWRAFMKIADKKPYFT